MPYKEHSIISAKFDYRSDTSHVRLNREQQSVRNRVQHKIDSKLYALEQTRCLCGAMDDETISGIDRYGLSLATVICRQCGLLRTNPRLDKRSLREFYIHEYRDLYMEAAEVSEDYFLNMVQRGQEILSLFREQTSLPVSGIQVLELGCSAGGILLPFLDAGATVKGYDYDERYLNFGNQRNASLNLCFGGIEELSGENKYDLIILNHVLEHLSDPRQTLELIRNRLNPHGYLYVGVPGLKNPAYYFSPTKSFLGSLHIGHLYHFTPQSLILLAAGYRVRYIDDQIFSLFQLAPEATEHINLVSEYEENVRFIREYESTAAWKVRRALLLLRNNIPVLIKKALPKSTLRFLKSMLPR